MNTTLAAAQDLLVFRSSGLHCAFPFETVQEIVPMARLFSPPGSPSLLAGFLDLRGFAIPILHLDRLFGLPTQLPGMYTPLVILRDGFSAVGILVEKVQQIFEAPEEAFRPLPENNVFQNCATAAVDVDGEMVYLLSAERILLEKERHILAEFQTIAQERLRNLGGT